MSELPGISISAVWFYCILPDYLVLQECPQSFQVVFDYLENKGLGFCLSCVSDR